MNEKLKPCPLTLPLVLREIDGAYWVEDSKGRVAIYSTRLSEKKHHAFLRWVVDTANTSIEGKEVENKLHHLRVTHKGFYQMRITVSIDKKGNGIRKVIGLGTKDQRQAVIRRDLILRVMKMIGTLSSSTERRCEKPKARKGEK